MTTMTDLTKERLDELEYEYGEEDRDDPRVLALIAMARAKQAAERERDALREERDRLQGLCDWLQEQVFDYQRQLIHCPVSAHDDWIAAALAQPTDAAHTNDAAPGITLSRTEEMWGASCDWGHCANIGTGFRWCADLSEWLPVCQVHLTGPHGDAQSTTDAGGA